GPRGAQRRARAARPLAAVRRESRGVAALPTHPRPRLAASRRRRRSSAGAFGLPLNSKRSSAMRRTLIILALLAGVNLWLIAQEPETPIGPKWWPSEYGADDQRGAANRLG